MMAPALMHGCFVVGLVLPHSVCAEWKRGRRQLAERSRSTRRRRWALRFARGFRSAGRSVARQMAHVLRLPKLSRKTKHKAQSTKHKAQSTKHKAQSTKHKALWLVSTRSLFFELCALCSLVPFCG